MSHNIFTIWMFKVFSKDVPTNFVSTYFLSTWGDSTLSLSVGFELVAHIWRSSRATRSASVRASCAIRFALFWASLSFFASSAAFLISSTLPSRSFSSWTFAAIRSCSSLFFALISVFLFLYANDSFVNVIVEQQWTWHNHYQ